MKIKFKVRDLLCALGALVLCAFQSVSVMAQCAMCKVTVQASSSANAAAATNAFNLAVLVLLIPPALLFSALFVVLLRYGRDAGGQPKGSELFKTSKAFD